MCYSRTGPAAGPGHHHELARHQRPVDLHGATIEVPCQRSDRDRIVVMVLAGSMLRCRGRTTSTSTRNAASLRGRECWTPHHTRVVTGTARGGDE
jgi:hypothetical protein